MGSCGTITKLWASAKDIRNIIEPMEKEIAKLKPQALHMKDIRKLLEPLEKEIAELKQQALHAKSHDPTEATEWYEQSIGNISELPAIHAIKDVQDRIAALEKASEAQEIRSAAFEDVVFSDESRGYHSLVDEAKAVAGRLTVSQHAAIKTRSRSSSRDSRKVTHKG